MSLDKRIKSLEERMIPDEGGRQLTVLLYIPLNRDGEPFVRQPTEEEKQLAIDAHRLLHPRGTCVFLLWQGDHFEDAQGNVLKPTVQGGGPHPG